MVDHCLEVCYDKIPKDKELISLEKEVERKASQINSKEKEIEWFLTDYKKTYQKKR